MTQIPSIGTTTTISSCLDHDPVCVVVRCHQASLQDGSSSLQVLASVEDEDPLNEI